MNPAENYIINQPEPYRSILMHVQAVIEYTVPQVELKYKYKIPFYYINNKPLCYLNASHKKQFVDVGFWLGTKIKSHQEHQVTEKRKQMFSLRYTSLETIEDVVLMDVLKEAITLY